ncbi:MAG: cysteine desulfurase [Candidatus Bathyarchaeota archaeon]|nr:cysteine desulfurase [Candidatus Termiticorpusculum sp.]
MDSLRIRDDFPILKRKISNNSFIYFDNAATSQKPRQVIQAMVDFYENHNANVHRGVHTLSLEATELYEQGRERVANFVNAKESSEIIFVRGTTEAINLVAYSWGLNNLKKNDEILVSLMEHHSNIVPWEITAKIRGFKINYANVTSDGILDVKDFENKINSKTKLVCLSHVSNVTGMVNEIKKLSKIVHDHGAIMLVDGAQSVPHMKVDVQDLNADFLVFSGHKMLGPTGIGVLYGKKELLQNMSPFQGGGEMIKDVVFDPANQRCNISWNMPPWKFEAGTPNICGVVGLTAAIKYLEQVGMDNILAHEQALTKYALNGMKNLGKIMLYGPMNSNKCGIITFGLAELSSHDIALLCDSYGVAIRSGYHCAQPLHQIFQLQSSARASFYLYNTIEEINRFIEVLKEIQTL